MTKNVIIAVLTVALGLSVAAGVVAQTQRTAEVQVRIFEQIEDPTIHYVASRPQGGHWTSTEPVPQLYDGFIQGGRWRYRDVFLKATVPQPVPTAIELFDLRCEDHVHPTSTHRILQGSFRNGTNATLTDITITAALVNEEGVEVLQLTDTIEGPVSPGGERPFLINFLRARDVQGTCPIVSIDYSAAVRFDVPIP